ncbi:hypothetical protein BH11VER1_BH11VER1_39490 [soil metagenome]
MKLFRHHFAGACLMLALVSCGTVAPYAPTALTRAKTELGVGTLGNAETLVLRAKLFRHEDSNVAIVHYLRAAEIAWTKLEQRSGKVESMESLSADEKKALGILQRVEAELALRFMDRVFSELTEWDFAYAGYSYHGSVTKPSVKGYYGTHEFHALKSADKVPHKLCKRCITHEGLGEPLAVHWKQPADEKLKRFVATRGYVQPITAVLSFSPKPKIGMAREVRLSFVDPTSVSRFRIEACDYPLAANYTAPIVENTREIKELWLSLTGVLDPRAKEAKLLMTEPYDPDRIPVVLVHGLFSHPRMWRDVLNELRADPELRGKYQYWLFYYPTGWPILYSASRLREEVEALENTLGRQHDMVFIGHSMGGLLARAQVISPGRQIWDVVLQENADRKMEKLPLDHLSKKMLLFKGNPDIGRIIFVCTPQRGSKVADLSIVGWLTRLIKMPVNIVDATLELGSEYGSKGGMSSITRLSPNDPLYRSWENIPISVPYHSIIGDRGRGNTPDSSDGIVPYWSSHLKGAQSELIVPGGHGAYDHPMAIEEMKRILELHLQSARGKQPRQGLN